jgi:hypothetical protein
VYIDICGSNEADLRRAILRGHFQEWKMPCGHYMKIGPEKLYSWIVRAKDRLW